MVIRNHVQINDRAIFDDLTSVENIQADQKSSKIRLARQAGGFAFDYWAHGGDLTDIESLVNCFDTMLGKNKLPQKRWSTPKESLLEEARDSRDSVVLQVLENARLVNETRNPGAWTMPLNDRLDTIQRWVAELGPSLIVDQVIEVHRRYQAALLRFEQTRQKLDVPLLEIRKAMTSTLRESLLMIEIEDVIGLTTTACAKFWPTLSQVGISTVLCEEAGEVIEAQSLCTLFPSVKHAIFIGDPLQLRYSWKPFRRSLY